MLVSEIGQYYDYISVPSVPKSTAPNAYHVVAHKLFILKYYRNGFANMFTVIILVQTASENVIVFMY
jgi:hypothetical protein